jgi:hypothetical protein
MRGTLATASATLQGQHRCRLTLEGWLLHCRRCNSSWFSLRAQQFDLTVGWLRWPNEEEAHRGRRSRLTSTTALDTLSAIGAVPM